MADQPEHAEEESQNELEEPIDIGDLEEWEQPPQVSDWVPGFGQRATLEIARYVLLIFAGVFLLCFILAFYMITLPGASYDKSVELIKFLIASVVPLATLAVGYYLGTASQGND